MLPVFATDPAAHALLAELLEQPSVYDEFLRYLHRHGYAVPAECWTGTSPRRTYSARSWCRCSATIYENAGENWDVYEACEELVDLEDNFQLWRFRHLQTVERTIGMKRGTGGSSGVGFLRRALELTFFPELYRGAHGDRQGRTGRIRAVKGAAGGGRSFHRRQRFGGRH